MKAAVIAGAANWKMRFAIGRVVQYAMLGPLEKYRPIAASGVVKSRY